VKRSLLLLAAAVVATFFLGCGQESGSPREGRSPEVVLQVAGKAALPAPAEEQARKIIYNARVELVVEEFNKAQEQLTRLVEEAKGYVAKSDTHGAPGSPRSGEWTLRIPVGQFREFIADLAKLGELRESKTDSDDVTDRYYDLKAHIQNDQAEEEALRKLMVDKSATGKLDDLLAVRRELRELRGTIDAQQGQMERWDKEAAMTAVVVQIQDRKDYVPTTSPSFGTSISRTFSDSLGALVAFGKGVVLFVVAVAPWLAVLAAPALGLWWLNRKRLKNLIARPKTVAPGP
jgi:Domain of unknown function (DUF4349)